MRARKSSLFDTAEERGLKSISACRPGAGALYLMSDDAKARFYLNDTSFRHNTVTTFGGSLVLAGAAHFELTRCVFYKNVAGDDGGAVARPEQSPRPALCGAHS